MGVAKCALVSIILCGCAADENDSIGSLSGPPSLTITSPAQSASTCSAVAVTFQAALPSNWTTSCRVDADPYAPCSSGTTFSGLAPGAHTIRVGAFNAGGHLNIERTVQLTVLASAPAIAISAPLDDATFVTGPSGAIDGSVTDGSPLDTIIDISCTVDGAPCGGAANLAAKTFGFSYAGLLDASSGGTPTHTVAVTATARCSAQGTTVDVPITRTATWQVDSTAPAISFNDFDLPFVAAPPQGPAGDITDDFNRVHFAVFDERDEPPYFVDVAIGTDPASSSCNPIGPSMSLCDAGFNNLPGGFTTATVSVADQYGNQRQATLLWTVDDTPPIVTFATSSPNNCSDVDGNPVFGASGAVAFQAVDVGGAGVAALSCQLFRFDGTFQVLANPVDCSDGTYEFTNLPSSAAGQYYQVRVTATDGVNNASIAAFSWNVDAAAPVVIHQPYDPVNTPFPDTFAPDVTPDAPFFTTSDPSAQAPSFTCVVDGVTSDCSDMTFSVTGLAEGAHQVQITGTDCVGNTATDAYTFYVDTNAPAMDWQVGSFSNGDGSGELDVQTFDAITNTQSIRCELDGAPGSIPSIPCALLGLPTMPSPSVARPRVFNGTLSLSSLSPGVHVLRSVAEDYWGHRGPVQATTFVVSFANARGHLFAIGRDFEDSSTGAAGEILGNMVYASPARDFSRPLKIALADPTQSATTAERQNVEAALCSQVQALRANACDCAGAPSCIDATYTTTTNLAEAIAGQDAIVFLDQDNAAAVASLGNSVTFADPLRTFLNSGGVVIVTNGTNTSGFVNNTHVLVKSLVDLGVETGADPNDATRMCESEDVTTLDAFGTPIETIPSAPTGVRFINHERGVAGADTNEVYVSDGSCSPCTALPVVIDKYFPARQDRGPVYVRAFADDGTSFGPGLATFERADHTLVVTCAVGNDGTVSHEIVQNMTVTVASDADPGTLLSMIDIDPYEQITLGRSVAPPATSSVDISWPAVMGASHYTISTGCESITVPASTLSTTLSISDACTTGGGQYGISFTAGITGAVLASAFEAFAGDPTFALGTWTLRTSTPPNMLDVSVAASPAFDASTDPFVASADTSFSLARGSVLFASSVPNIGAAASGYVPSPSSIPTGRARLALDYEGGGSSAVNIATLGSTAITSNLFLPRLTSFTLSGSNIVFGTSSTIWSGAPLTPLTVADADGMLVTLRANDSSCSVPMAWHIAFAPSSGQSSVTLPSLTTLPCTPNDAAGGFEATLFSTGDRAAARRAMQDTIDRIASPAARPAGITRTSHY